MTTRARTATWTFIGLGAGLFLLALACTGAGGGGQAQAPPAPPPAPAEQAPPLFTGLGSHSWKITTRIPQAQTYFDQGLALAYALQPRGRDPRLQLRARRSTRSARCAPGASRSRTGPTSTCRWVPTRRSSPSPRSRSRRAPGLRTGARSSRTDRGDSAKRYAADAPTDRAALDRAFADAMIALRAKYPDNTDVAVIAAEAIMDTSPWNYWDEQPEAARAHAQGAGVSRVDARRGARPPRREPLLHPPDRAAHAREGGARGGSALEARARRRPPRAHALAHLLARGPLRGIGRRERGGREGRTRASSRCAARGGIRSTPRSTTRTTSTSSGRRRSAEGQQRARAHRGRAASSRRSRDKLAQFPLLEDFLTIPTLTLVRFGHWDAILAEPAPPAGRVYHGGIWHYARGMAFVRKGELDEGADRARRAARSRRPRRPRRKRLRTAGVVLARSSSASRRDHLAGELALAKRRPRDGRRGAARRGRASRTASLYTEPPPWYFPTRQALGRRAARAWAARARPRSSTARTSRTHPKNGWSLYGLAQSLRAQGKTDRGRLGRRRASRNAWARADVTAHASRF